MGPPVLRLTSFRGASPAKAPTTTPRRSGKTVRAALDWMQQDTNRPLARGFFTKRISTACRGDQRVSA